MSEFVIKDSGARAEFDSGMVRDTEEGKVDLTNLLHGPMLIRWAEHLTRAKAKYPDPAPGIPNWTLASGEEELQRYKRSAFRHLIQWLNGETDEDHAAAVMFNINGAEYVKAKLEEPSQSIVSARGNRGVDEEIFVHPVPGPLAESRPDDLAPHPTNPPRFRGQ